MAGGLSGSLGGPDHPEIRTNEGKPRGMGNKNYHTMLKENSLKRKYCTLRYIVVTMGYNSNNICGKCWAVVGSKLTGPIEDPDYRGPDYRGLLCVQKLFLNSGNHIYLTTWCQNPEDHTSNMHKRKPKSHFSTNLRYTSPYATSLPCSILYCTEVNMPIDFVCLFVIL